MKLSQTPILRLYHLTIDSKNKEKFEAEGVRNMTTSIKNEAGTLFMTATHADQAGQSNYVLECYQDLAHYNIHAHSPQFKHYGSVAQQVLTGHKMFELTPRLIETKPEKLLVTGRNNYYVCLRAVSLVEGAFPRFSQALQTETAWASRQEANFLAVLAGSLLKSENEWRILEVYRNQAAYQKHLQTDWFKQFASQTKAMIDQAQSTQLTVATLVDQGSLEYQ